MENKMTPIPFERLLMECMDTFNSERKIFQVPFCDREEMTPIGPAAGPHTQLAGNIVAAFCAGASHFELKTVQKLFGEELGIQKPCIYTAHEAYNVEWSSEFSPVEAMEEYIKAYLLISLLSLEIAGRKGIKDAIPFKFWMSVGYTYEGITSSSVDEFIEGLHHASKTAEWKKDMELIKKHIDLFQHVSLEQIDAISDVVSDTITLSTLHGCPAEDIEKIATYLLAEKKCNTYVKMNPTLLGKEKVLLLLEQQNCKDIQLAEEAIANDITFSQGVRMIENLLKVAKEKGVNFGVKLTNTLPVKTLNRELAADAMYLSGPLLFPCAINVARELSHHFKGKLKISFSGGADAFNIEEILSTGIYPVTVSTILLKQNGYKNLSMMLKKITNSYCGEKDIDLTKLNLLADHASENERYSKKEIKRFETREGYSALCAKCNNCVDVCPNRANRRVNRDGIDVVIHIPELCNECGNCTYFCIMGHVPYKEKLN